MKKICVVCGKEFEIKDKRHSALTCSLECGKERQRINDRDKKRLLRAQKKVVRKRICPWCKTEFEARNNAMMFCKPECRIEYNLRHNQNKRTTNPYYAALIGRGYQDTNKTLTEKSIIAKQKGISYGQMKAEEFLEKVPKIDVRL